MDTSTYQHTTTKAQRPTKNDQVKLKTGDVETILERPKQVQAHLVLQLPMASKEASYVQLGRIGSVTC